MDEEAVVVETPSDVWLRGLDGTLVRGSAVLALSLRRPSPHSAYRQRPQWWLEARIPVSEGGTEWFDGLVTLAHGDGTGDDTWPELVARTLSRRRRRSHDGVVTVQINDDGTLKVDFTRW